MRDQKKKPYEADPFALMMVGILMERAGVPDMSKEEWKTAQAVPFVDWPKEMQDKYRPYGAENLRVQDSRPTSSGGPTA